MSSILNARRAGFADNLYTSLVISKICFELCLIDRVTPARIKKIDQYALRV